MLEQIIKINSAVNNFVWGVPAMICIIGVGLLLSCKTRFLQLRKFGYAMKLQLLERQRTFRYEAGKRAFDELMVGIRQQVSSL